MGTKLRGRVHKFGDHIDTDAIIPARYLVTTDESELAKHCMEPIDPSFPSRVARGDILVAGENFGCGSSREHAPLAIKGTGISCIIAKSFARIFYRNAINIGLPILECASAAEEAEDGDLIECDLESGVILNLTKGTQHQAEPFPEFMRQIIESGGLINFVRRRLEERKSR
ncbi:MAG: 3-isopropylmalate dehydratase small subunit [Armatimonadota bacterium]|nr:3-isopropylmalate dehydratase small subunit [Armatimonadota bacterium]MCX7776873.1 3-isopropylmalate dehydratase small subunit [Armatimonadota bacterium]MDW8024441.1 3-isopropylmalate dehydratase small subunit [Armatimonadota bacterium]